MELDKNIKDKLDTMLEKGEYIIQSNKKPWAYHHWYKSIWYVITNHRVIVVEHSPIETKYRTYDVADINTDFIEGVIFDTVDIFTFEGEIQLKFAATDREETLKFYHTLQRATEKLRGHMDEKGRVGGPGTPGEPLRGGLSSKEENKPPDQ